MEQQKTRIFLLLGLIFVGVLLHGKWQELNPTPLPGVERSEPAIPSTAPDIPHVTIGQHDDIPANVARKEAVLTTVPDNRRVNIKTDLYDLTIDSLGGDIINLSLNKYHQSLENKNGFVLLDNSEQRNYVVQTGLLGDFGPDNARKGRGQFVAAQKNYTMQGDTLAVPLEWHDNHGLTVIKTFNFTRDSYVVDVEYEIINNSETDFIGRMYGQIKQEEKPQKKGLSSMHTYTGAAIYTKDTPYKKLKFDKLAKEPFNQTITGGWAAMVEHYFLSAWIPNPEKINTYYAKSNNDKTYTIGSMGPSITVAPDTKEVVAGKLYLGPEKADVLKDLSKGLQLTVDYGFLWPISSTIFYVLKMLYSFVGNWGVAIILVTVLIKLLFFKLSAASYKSMGRMRKLQPQIKSLKDKYGDDRQGMSQAMMALYKKEKINPLGGCLPILVQIPVFIALYYVLLESVELRQAPFMFWIQDLSIKDPLYVLPILMGISMLLQQKLNPTPPDPMQAKIFMLMPIVFTVLFLNFPAGLVLYWVVNNVLSILQQYIIVKKIENSK